MIESKKREHSLNSHVSYKKRGEVLKMKIVMKI